MKIMQYANRLRGGTNLGKAQKNGLRIGKNLQCAPSVFVDPAHCFLISIGDDCTLTSKVHILAHDASTKNIWVIRKSARWSLETECSLALAPSSCPESPLAMT